MTKYADYCKLNNILGSISNNPQIYLFNNKLKEFLKIA